jgi:hypothetical protein
VKQLIGKSSRKAAKNGQKPSNTLKLRNKQAVACILRAKKDTKE